MPFDGCGSRRRCPPTARELAASNGPSGAQNIENTVQANPAMTPRTHLHPSRWDRDAPIRHLAPAPGRPTSKTPHGSRSLSIWSDRASCLGGKGPWGHVPPAGRRERPAQIGHPRHNDRKDNRLGPPRLSSAPPSHPACRPPTNQAFLPGSGLPNRQDIVAGSGWGQNFGFSVGATVPRVWDLSPGGPSCCSCSLTLFDLPGLNTEQPARVSFSSSPPLDRSINPRTARALLFSPEHATASDGNTHRQDASAPVRLPLCHRHHLRRA